MTYRAWQFHVLKPEYVTESMKLARKYDVNTVVFSHKMIGFTSDLYDGSDRAGRLRALAVEAHRSNLKVWIWVRELNDVPAEFMDGRVVDMDRPGFWDWLRRRYEGVFRDFPEFDGVMLTFHETPYKVFSPRVRSALPIPERFAGVCGYNVRVDHNGYDAIHTPNEINLYALYRMSQDSEITADDIWKEWTEMRYGGEAARSIERSLRPTFLLRRVAIIWKLHAEAAFGYQILASGQSVPGLRERVERAIGALAAQASVSALDPLIGQRPPGSAQEIGKVTSELRKMLDELPSKQSLSKRATEAVAP